MTGRKWIGALTLLATLISTSSFGSGPFVESRALGIVMTRTQSSVMINGAPALSGTTVFRGDVLQTRNASTASGETSLRLQPGDIRKQRGCPGFGQSHRRGGKSEPPSRRHQSPQSPPGPGVGDGVRSLCPGAGRRELPGGVPHRHGRAEFGHHQRSRTRGDSRLGRPPDSSHWPVRNVGSRPPAGRQSNCRLAVTTADPEGNVQRGQAAPAPLRLNDTVYWQDVVKTAEHGPRAD
jgi:hypothetical protein